MADAISRSLGNEFRLKFQLFFFSVFFWALRFRWFSPAVSLPPPPKNESRNKKKPFQPIETHVNPVTPSETHFQPCLTHGNSF